MSRWFRFRRQEFIATTLRQFGQIRRADLIREFDISAPQASNDIAEFLSANPPNVKYDVSAKAYILEEESRLIPFAYGDCRMTKRRLGFTSRIGRRHGRSLRHNSGTRLRGWVATCQNMSISQLGESM